MDHFPGRAMRSGVLLVAAAAVALPLTVTLFPVPAGASTANTSNIVYSANPPRHLAFTATGPTSFPYTPSQCVKVFGFDCYTPSEIRTAYNFPSSLSGAGQTIVIVDAFGSPTIASDLHIFDQTFGLPDPTLNIFYPTGRPAFNANDANEADWAFETSLDVEWAHAMAPAATIDLVVAATNSGNVLNVAEKYAVSNHLGSVMSMSFGAPEASIAGAGNNLQLQQADQIYHAAQAAGITVIASAGDAGATDYPSYTTPNPEFPASDPLVLSVGGTDLFTANNGAYRSETAWNDFDPSLCPYGCSAGPFGATGGAPSATFDAPSYQQGVTGFSTRTTSDVAYNASVYTGILVYVGFLPTSEDGFYFVGGTSEGAPQWAAIVALADQAAGKTLGFLNPSLYAVLQDPKAYKADFHDVTVGNNENPYPGPGFSAGKGYDLPTGLGSPNVANLVKTLTTGQ